MMASIIEERRNFPRIKLYTPIRYQTKDRPDFNHTVSRDISIGGIGFINHKFIAPKTPVVLEINLASYILKPRGRIAWSEPLPHSDRYRLGIEFLELNFKEKNYLRDFINMQKAKL